MIAFELFCHKQSRPLQMNESTPNTAVSNAATAILFGLHLFWESRSKKSWTDQQQTSLSYPDDPWLLSSLKE